MKSGIPALHKICLPRKEVIHPQLPLRMPCYDFVPVICLTFCRSTPTFGYYRLPWRDGRCVQDPRTYSTHHGWYAFTSDSSFMRSSCRPQSELRPVLVGLAPPYGLATLCTGHCSTCVAQDVRAMLIWRHPRLPPPTQSTCIANALSGGQFSVIDLTQNRGCARCPT